MSRKPQGSNQLAEWLKRHNVTQETFCQMMQTVRGFPADQTQVSAWCCGRTTPNRGSRLDIEAVTSLRGDPVKADSWGDK